MIMKFLRVPWPNEVLPGSLLSPERLVWSATQRFLCAE
jgi:hypothetical protein